MKASTAVADIIALLRSVEEKLHFRAVLATVGAVLLVAGCFWAGVRFLASNSYLLLVLAGVVCIAISAIADPQGLLRHLPNEAQDFLLNRRIFDLIHDDSPITNLIRKWGRVQLLAQQDGTSEGAVQQIVQSMDPVFVHMIMCRSFLSFLPLPLQHLMLPRAACSKNDVPKMVAPDKPCADAGMHAPSTSWLVGFLQKRHQAKLQNITEPELFPLVARTVCLQTALLPFRSGAQSLLRWLKAFAVTAGTGCFISAGLLYRGWGSKVLLDALATGGLMPKLATQESANKTSRLAAAVSLLSAGGAIAFSLYCDRWSRLLLKDAGAHRRDQPFEPEREASPPSSEVSS